MGLMKHSGFPGVTQQDGFPTRSFHTAQKTNDVAEWGSTGANKNMSVDFTKDFLIKQQNPFLYQVIVAGYAVISVGPTNTKTNQMGN